MIKFIVTSNETLKPQEYWGLSLSLSLRQYGRIGYFNMAGTLAVL